MENKFGKTSELHLTAENRGGRTILSDVAFTAPFKIMRPFYEKPGLMTVMLLTASAGIMAGDRQRFEITVQEGARMEFVSQAYEKIHKMDAGGHAERSTHISVEKNACLFYTPLPAIPFAGSDYRSRLEADLADASSQFVFSEILTCGRTAHGEKFGYRSFRNEILIRQGGELVYRDNTCYIPDEMDMEGFGMYEGFTHLANLVICNIPKSDAWIRAARENLDAADRMEGGVTRTAQGQTTVRILGMSGQKLTEKLTELLQLPDPEQEA